MGYSNVGGCEWSHMFDKERRARCEEQYFANQQSQSQADMLLAQAALESARKEDKSWSAMATVGVVVGSLIGVALLVVVIKKMKKK